MACRTYAELQAEMWWSREIVTDELRWCAGELCRRTGAPATNAGTKGNNCHLNGGHRSQEWIQHSRYCTNHSYTVQSGLSAEQLRHVAALDFVPLQWGTAANRARVAEQTQRLYQAAKTGQLDGITQVQGTLDGVTPFGYNVISGTTFQPDSSHLEHWHLTGDRRHMRDTALMRKIVDTALGDDMPSKFVSFGDGESVPGGTDEVAEFQNNLTKLGADFAPVGGIDGKYGKGTQTRYIQVVGAELAGDGTHYNWRAADDVERRIADQETARYLEEHPQGGANLGEVHIEIPGISIPPETIVVPVVPTGSK